MLIDLIGWIGAGFILLGYFLVSTKRVNAAAKSYQFINLVGGIGLVINAYFRNAIPLVGLNLVWVIIAIKSLTRR